MSYNDNNIVVNMSYTRFCVGPCNSKKEEPKPITIDYGKKHFIFKPNSGDRYKQLCYPLNKDTYLILKNARICCGCNSRYLEFKEENDNESLERDAKTIRKKLGI